MGILIVVKVRTSERTEMLLKGSHPRLTMDILSNPVFAIVPFAIWIGLIAVALYTMTAGEEKFPVPLRSARVALDEHLTRGDIGREEYVERRKGLDHVTAIV
jgi:hypothetical protein